MRWGFEVAGNDGRNCDGFQKYEEPETWHCPNCGIDCGGECEGFANGSIRHA
jgi:hypothetical protein